MEMQTAAAENGNTPRQYAALDACKLFFAVCVVAIHTYATNVLPEPVDFWITQSVFRLAVPFFFVASGFMLGKKLHGEGRNLESTLTQYIKKLLPPLLWVGTANGLLELLLQHLRNGTDIRSAATQFAKHFFFYPYGAMWYVQASIIGALLLYPFLKRKKLNRALVVGALLYGWALLCNNYYFAAQASGLDGIVDAYMTAFISARNGVFVGFFWLALGVKTCEWHRRAWSHRVLIPSLAVFAALYLIEIYLLKGQSYLDDRALYITQIGLIPAGVLGILNLKLPIARRTSVLMRKASTWIYFFHRLFYVLCRIVWYLAFAADWRGAGAFIVVMAMSTAAFCAVYVKNRAWIK